MKQAHLGGRTKGLRRSQQRQLDRLSQRRHPEGSGVDILALERLSELVLKLKTPLHLVIDGRGLCRLLWLGPLSGNNSLLEHIPNAPRRQSGGWRLVSCSFCKDGLSSDPADAVVALDLAPRQWLRFGPNPAADGIRTAELLLPDSSQANGWRHQDKGDLRQLCKIEPEEHFPLTERTTQSAERVLLLTLTENEPSKGNRELAELKGLVRSAGRKAVAVVSQRRSNTNLQTLWGRGKLQEAALEVLRNGASLVITDRELTPVQARNIERLVNCPVSDRSELILDIFAQRAGSAAGRLQVELAQLRYRLPRLLGRGQSLSRQGGGIGTRGAGETQLEKDRRAISRRIERLLRDQHQLQIHRSRLRDQRRGLPRVALVGYTNAGKSSLLNALCGKRESDRVLVENKLFATLDPTTRKLDLPRPGDKPKRMLLTDTVGFIRDLPAPLVEAFRATFEEALDADLVLLVVDLADPNWIDQLGTVHRLLDSLGSTSLRRVVANQIDRCDLEAISAIREQEPDVLLLSAVRGDGLQELQEWLRGQFFDADAKSPAMTTSNLS
ncbi:GTPase HflX [Synechococcus sp. M16CYN]|uniref:GTPase HflX n=1 Tax=Synechococcus sp. M16CYN TaxID=3103139 RepID=UPI0030E3207E